MERSSLNANAVERTERRTKFQRAVVKNGLRGKEFRQLGKEAGNRGKTFGKQGGRPRKKSNQLELREIENYLKSSEFERDYPVRVRGKREKRRAFKKKRNQFRLTGERL